MNTWALTVLLLIFPFFAAVNGKKKRDIIPRSKTHFYLLTIATDIVLLGILLLIDTKAFKPIDFSITGKGFIISDEIWPSFTAAFFVPLILSFTPWNNYLPKELENAREIFGLPVGFMPDHWKTFFLFVPFIMISVVFEELVCRQLMFYAFSQTLGLKGDGLLLFTSVLFSIAHWYQGWKGLLSSFLAGLVFGKIFQLTGNLWYPIVLHLALNLTVAVLAYKRIRILHRKQWTNETEEHGTIEQ